MNLGDTVKLSCVDRLYTVLEINTHNEGTIYEERWAVLKPLTPSSHTAHWPLSMLEPVCTANP